MKLSDAFQELFSGASFATSFECIDAELYRHHTAFTIKIVFDWELNPLFTLREENSIVSRPGSLSNQYSLFI